jgi:GT2 family glycosyltransferase
LRSEYDGSQDWDLVLRLVERTNRIAHIPKVLYHARISGDSATAARNLNNDAIEASRRARIDALKRRKMEGTLDPVPQAPGSYRVNYAPQGEPLISIIIPSKNNGCVLRQCLEAILERSRYRNFEVLVIDNGSTEGSTLTYLDQIRQHPKVTVLRHDVPFNFSELCNKGASSAGGSVLLFLNDDTEVISPAWLEQMAGYAQLQHIGAVGAKLIYPNTRLVQHNGVLSLADGPVHAFLRKDADDPGYFARNVLEYDWLAITGACMMIEKSKFQMAGGFDELFPIAYNDVELCFRLVEKGWYNVVCQGAELVHHESLSRGLDSMDRTRQNRLKADRSRLYRTHPGYFMRDPFHNPNLHPNDASFSLPQ